MNTAQNSTLTTEQLYAKLTIANGETIEINGTTYTCINSVSNSNNGYQGFAYKNNSTGNIIVVHAGLMILVNFLIGLLMKHLMIGLKQTGSLLLILFQANFILLKIFLKV